MAGKNISFRDFQKVLKKNNYNLVRYTGSHAIWENNDGKHIAINIHPNPIVIQRLIKEYKLNV